MHDFYSLFFFLFIFFLVGRTTMIGSLGNLPTCWWYC